MDKPEEIDLKIMIFGSILIILLLTVSIIFFFILYQKRLLTQQTHLQQVKSDYQRQLLASSVDVQEQERARIGHDLHDEIGSSLSTIKLLINQIQWHDEESHKIVMNVKSILSDTIQNVRNISLNLHPAVLERFGLTDALENLVSIVSEASSLSINYEADDIIGLTYIQQLALYRIVQELINNAIKHAHAENLSITLSHFADKISLIVKDDGVGYNHNATNITLNKGIGLKSIEARAAMLEAIMEIESESGKGTQVELYMVPANRA